MFLLEGFMLVKSIYEHICKCQVMIKCTFIFYYLTIKKNTEKYCKHYKIVDNENALHWDLKSIIESGMRHVYSLTPFSIVLCFIEFLFYY